MAVLIAFGGLPGTGKTTVARHLAQLLPAVFLRIETIETTLQRLHPERGDNGADGYHIGAELAEANLRLGLDVIADSLNPTRAMREIWARAAARADARLLEVEIRCSDPELQRVRLEGRAPDLPGHVPPAPGTLLAPDWQDWPGAALRLDTARLSPDAAAKAIAARLAGTLI